MPVISKNEFGEPTLRLTDESVAKIQKNVIVGLITEQKTQNYAVGHYFLSGCYMEDFIAWVKWRQVLCRCVVLWCRVPDVQALDLVLELDESECGVPEEHGKLIAWYTEHSG